ncbi:MAG: DUF559 domain-containing protein [Chloroflexia bacterium]
MADENSVLVAVMNNARDWKLAREDHWYRIPVDKAVKWGRHHWPPRWLAFYQTRVFGDEAYSVRYYAHVHEIHVMKRRDLFPEEDNDKKSDDLYYKLLLSPLQVLGCPIKSLRLRRITFIPTTWHKFRSAEEVNDLWDESPLEDNLWAELKRRHISAERQEFIRLKRQQCALDFTLYCAEGKLNVETDGDHWHSDPKRIAADNRRDNALQTQGWRLLRCNTIQVREQLNDYCLPTIIEVIDDLGGLSE